MADFRVLTDDELPASEAGLLASVKRALDSFPTWNGCWRRRPRHYAAMWRSGT